MNERQYSLEGWLDGRARRGVRCVKLLQGAQVVLELTRGAGGVVQSHLRRWELTALADGSRLYFRVELLEIGNGFKDGEGIVARKAYRDLKKLRMKE